MDLHSLQTFVVVAERRSFSLAAEQLHLTQPAVSKRIAGLEGSLQTRLFDRIGRDARLTQAGQQLLPRARSVLQQLRQAEQAIRDLSATVSGTLHMATSHHIGLHHLPPVLRRFSDQYPEVRLRIEFTDSEKAHEAVARGELELAVITLSPEESERVASRLLWPDPLCFVASREHPLGSDPPGAYPPGAYPPGAYPPGTSGEPATLSLAQLGGQANVLPGLDTYTGQIVKRLFDSQGLPLDTLMTTNYMETIKMMVSVGLGWSVLPRSMVDDSLRILPVATPPLSRRLGYIRNPRHTLSNAAGAFIRLLEESAIAS